MDIDKESIGNSIDHDVGPICELFDELLTSEDAKQAEKMMWVVPRHIQETIKPPPMRITCMC